MTLYLEKLHSDTGKHELKERRDDQDVADGPDGHKHTLHHVLRGQEARARAVLERCTCSYSMVERVKTVCLQSFRPVDGSKGPEHTQHSQDLHHRNRTRTGNSKTGGKKTAGGGRPLTPSFSRAHSLQKEGGERHADDQQVQEVEGVPAEGSGVQESAVDGHLQNDLHRENRGEDVIGVAEHLSEGEMGVQDPVSRDRLQRLLSILLCF